MQITVPEEVYVGILQVRDSGLTNMFDRPQVIHLLRQMEFPEAAEWVEQNKSEYAEGIFSGFNVNE